MHYDIWENMQKLIYWLRILKNMEPYEVDSFISELDNKVSELLMEKEMLLEAIETGLSVMKSLRDQLE